MAGIESETIGPFIVGANGRRSGLAITKAGHFELRVLVVPKLWKSAASLSATVSVGESLTIIAPEGAAFTIKVVCDNSNRCQLLKNCFGQLTARAAKESENRLAGSLEDDDDGEEIRRAPLIKSDSRTTRSKQVGLIDIEFVDSLARPGGEAVLFLDPPRGRDGYFRSCWRAVQSLWLKSLALQDLSEIPLDALAQMSADSIVSQELALLLYLAFIRRVSELLHHARPGYSRVTRPSAFIRGRMNPSSAAVVLAGGATTVECTYDEFDLDTLLLRVIVTALEEVAEADVAALGVAVSDGPADEAAWLRRKLEPVSSLPPVAALRIGTDLKGKMSKLDGDWATALDLSCLILESRSLSPAPGSQKTALSWDSRRDNAFIFDISTEVCWENLVRTYFKKVNAGKVRKPNGEHSWDGLGKPKAPDGSFSRAGSAAMHDVIFDAKYKQINFGDTPQAGDQHQAFAYSHLFDSKLCLLVYPARNEQSEAASQTYGRYGGGCDLAMLYLRFPTTDDLLSRSAWLKFLNERQAKCDGLVTSPPLTQTGPPLSGTISRERI
jgi:5-methylcytosine-specific restriction endonuclease McrBC regulatory subunit McrC